MRKTKNLLKSPIPIWLVILLVVLTATPGVYAVLTVQNRTYTSIFGEIVNVTEDLSIVTNGIDISPSPKSAAGTSSASPITMTASGDTARTDIAKGNYFYSVDVSVTTLSASTKYNVTLYKEESGTWVGMGSLYVQQGGTPSVDDKAVLSWDMSASLSSSVYKVKIETYT